MLVLPPSQDLLTQQRRAREVAESRVAQMSKLPEQVASMRVAMEEIRREFEAVSTENSALQIELARAQDSASTRQAALDQAVAAERLKLETEIAQMAQAQQSLTQDLQTTRSQLAQAQSAADASTQRLALLEQQLAASANLSNEVETLSRRVREAESEIATRRTTNLNLQQTLNNERQRLEAEISSLRNDNRSLGARLSQAQTTLDQIASAARVLNPNTSSLGSGAFSSNTSSAAAEAPVSERFHLVVEGDSLTRISLRYYGTSSRWQEIYQANREVLSASNALRPGQRLRIP